MDLSGRRPVDGDLDAPQKVAEMVRRFYADVGQDTLLGPMFNDVAHTDWSAHLPKLTAFWCRALFSMPGYEGNPYRSHQRINDMSPFTVAHFEVARTVLRHRRLRLGGPQGRAGQGPRPQGRRRALPPDRRRTRQSTFEAAGTIRGVVSDDGVHMP